MELNRAIERLKLERQLAHLRLPQTQADTDLCDAIDTVLDELEKDGTENGNAN